MFTFSFGSAFAAKTYEAQAADGDQLYEASDVTAGGAYGITGAEKAKVVGEIEDLYATLTTGNNYYAKEKAAAKTLIAQAVKDAEAATTAKALKAVKDDLVADLKELTDVVKNAKEVVIAASTEEINLKRIYERYKDTAGFDGTFVLEGYGKFVTANYPADEYIVKDSSDKALKDIVDTYGFVQTYLLDNGYVKSYQIADGIAAMISELKPVNTAYKDAAAKEKNAIQDKVWAYADKYSATARDNRLTVSDIDGMYAVIGEMADFADKYTASGVSTTFDTATFVTAYGKMVEKYFDAFDAETIKIPEVAKLTDADKETVIALYDKIDAYYDEFKTNHKADAPFAVDTKANLVEDYAYVENAYNYFLDADKTAYGKLEAFEEIHVVGTKAYFDDSEKNVKAMEAARKAYDEFVATYGYGVLANDVATEAKIVVAEHNYKLAAGYDEKADQLESSKVQAYLNNATIKVTTKALGNKKVRVQATIDATSFNYILGEMNDGCTVSYQFYYKKAANTTYKAGKVKDVNYTTFKLTKGVKYNFQCKVVIKDADGKVVATKDYKASTVGTRTVK